MSEISDYQLDKMFADFLDEIYGEVEICGHKYQSSSVLEEVDPIAYRCGFSDWLDSQLTDGFLFEHSDGSIHDEEETDEQPT